VSINRDGQHTRHCSLSRPLLTFEGEEWFTDSTGLGAEACVFRHTWIRPLAVIWTHANAIAQQCLWRLRTLMTLSLTEIERWQMIVSLNPLGVKCAQEIEMSA